MSRPYVPGDVTRLQACSKLELLALVQSQLSKWPKDVQFSKKLRKNEYIVQLLDLANGFVTYWPPPTSIPPLSTLPPQLAEMLANQPPPPSLTPRVDALTLPELLEYFGMDRPQPASLTPLVDTLSAMLAPAAGPSSNPSLLPPPPPPSAPPPLSQHNDISSQLGGPLLSPFSSPPPPDRLSKGKESTNVDLSNPQDVGLEFSKPPPEFLEVQDSELKLVVDSEVHNRIAVSPDAQSSSSTKPIRNKSSNTARRSRSPYSPSTSRIQHLNPIIDLESLASGSRHNPVELDGDDNDDNDDNIVILQPSKKLLKSRKIELVDPELQSLIRAEDGFNVFASAKGKVLLNRTIMSQWLFADRMVTKYKNYVLSSGHLVRRYQIIRALGYEASWGRQARDGAKLINVYGPAGLHPAPEVIAKLDAKEPSGAGPLLDYLRSYADAHPIN
ncbi:hypothetical protein ONZ45_g92 [Pleurotus djamor]|nr:hypothetical protein ONZ45_g92 [Pleurotus djamor]